MRKPFVLSGVLAIVFCLMSAISGWAAVTEYSNWTQSLSGLTDDATYAWNEYDSFKMVVSGQNVHVVWVAGRTDGGEKRLNYRRSTDGGKTFRPVQVLATDFKDFGGFDSSWQGLAIDGDTVHVVYHSGWPSSVKYLRSTDNGANFEPVKIIHSNEWSGYYGIYMVASNGLVTVALAANHATNAPPYTQDVLCFYSNDGGVNFDSTTIAHADAGQPPYQFGVEDMIRSGANIYILYSVQDINWYTSEGRLYLVSSNDGGVTFNPPQRVTVASSNGGYYRNTIQNGHYSPNLATVGNNVYVTWVNTEVNNIEWYTASTYTTRFRRSTDKGLTLEDPITLMPSPTSNNGSGGLETIVASGSNVYIVTSYLNDSTYFWRSTDSGSTFEPPQKISNGGWWPTLLLDPNDSAKLHIANGYYVTSTDSGASFNGVVALPPSSLYGQSTPILAVGNDGVVHWAATYSRYDASSTQDIYYRRLAPAPAASGTPKVLNLVTDSAKRRDNMQIAATPDINLTSAMTIEYWVKMDFQGDGNNWSHFQTEVAKKRASGYGSYEMGYWNGFSGFYGRMVTENTDQYGGSVIWTDIVPKDLTWHHVAMTYDAAAGANNWKYYVNGVLATWATLTGKIVMDNMPLVLGPDTSGVNGTLQFSDFRIWNKARTAAEIMTDMNSTLTGTEPGLMAYYTFSDTTRDMTGNGNDGVLMFKESFQEFSTISESAIEWVQKTYIAYYGRPGDPAGVEYWADRLDSGGGDLSSIIDAFGASQEFTDNYASLSNDQLIDTIYRQMFNRDPDAAGKQWYLEQLNSGAMTLQSITLSVLSGAQNKDLSIIENKLAVVAYFTAQLKSSGVSYKSVSEAKELLSLVDETAASVESVKAQFDDLLANWGTAV